MSLTLGKVNTASRSYVAGNHVEVLVDFTCDSSYPTNGYPLTAKTLGLSRLDHLVATPAAASTATVDAFTYDYANSLLKATLGGTEVTNATDISTITGRLRATGKGYPTTF